MKNIIESIALFLKKIFGYGIMLSLFAGGLTFFGYLAALIIGGETAVTICNFIYEKFLPVVIYLSSSLILLGLLTMYLSGETALTTSRKKKTKENTKT